MGVYHRWASVSLNKGPRALIAEEVSSASKSAAEVSIGLSESDEHGHRVPKLILSKNTEQERKETMVRNHTEASKGTRAGGF